MWRHSDTARARKRSRRQPFACHPIDNRADRFDRRFTSFLFLAKNFRFFSEALEIRIVNIVDSVYDMNKIVIYSFLHSITL